MKLPVFGCLSRVLICSPAIDIRAPSPELLIIGSTPLRGHRIVQLNVDISHEFECKEGPDFSASLGNNAPPPRKALIRLQSRCLRRVESASLSRDFKHESYKVSLHLARPKTLHFHGAPRVKCLLVPSDYINKIHKLSMDNQTLR